MAPTPLISGDAAPAAQRNRRCALLAASRQALFPLFDSEGAWIGTTPPPSVRERCWHCLALFEGEQEHIARANRVLETSVVDDNDFMGYMAALLLRLHDDKLSSDARHRLLLALGINLEHIHDHLYRYTENCATLNAYTLLEGAERFQEPRYAERALEWLQVYAQFMTHNGVTLEYLSTTYLPVTFCGLAAIINFTGNEEAVALAREIESRCWWGLAGAWHPGLRHSAGPSGRSYTTDSMAGTSLTRGIVWLALGDRACPSPWDLGVFDDPPGCAIHQHDLPFHHGGLSWMAATEYHLDEDTAALFYDKPYPFTLRASVDITGYREHEPAPSPTFNAERLGGWRSGEKVMVPATIFHPGGRAAISAYMTPDYGLGAASRTVYGQTDFCFALWRKNPDGDTLADQRTLFTRYVINDNFEEQLGRDDFSALLPEQGRGGALADGPLALVWYAGGETVTHSIARLRTCAILPAYFNDIDELFIGDTPCPTLDGVSENEEWVFLRDGVTYLGLHPLALTDHGSRHAIEITRAGSFRAISFINYDGPACNFHPAVLRQTTGGFLCCLGSATEWGDFTNFRRSCQGATLTDTTYQSQRRMHARWEEYEVEMLWDMQTEERILAKVHGKLLESPVLEFSG